MSTAQKWFERYALGAAAGFIISVLLVMAVTERPWNMERKREKTMASKMTSAEQEKLKKVIELVSPEGTEFLDMWVCRECKIHEFMKETLADENGYCENCGENKVVRVLMVVLGEE